MDKDKKWQVYIIQTKSGKFYTGITTDIARRFVEHSNKKGAKYFRLEKPQDIIFIQVCKNRSEATKIELELKKLNRNEKMRLVNKLSLESTFV